MSMIKHRVVYDLEQLSNFHSFTGYDLSTNKVHVFVIHDSRNDFVKYVAFLEECALMIGYNNLRYDYPMVHYILSNKYNLAVLGGDKIARKLYKESQRIIDSQRSEIPSYNVLIPQLDLMRINSLDNIARLTSLKKLQIAMRWHNVQEMPIHYSSFIRAEQIQEILDYNLNDVLSTLEFLKYSQDRIAVRKELSVFYNTDLMNAGDIKIGTEIFASELSKKMNIDKNVLKRNIIDYSNIKINVAEILLPYLKFKQKAFKCVLDLFSESVMTPDKIAGFFSDLPMSKIKSTTLNEAGETVISDECIYYHTNKNAINKRKNSLDYLNVIFEGREYVFGAGGLHMSIEPGIVEECTKFKIKDRDVTAYYPSLSIENNFYPLHLGEIFIEVYRYMRDRRNVLKKEAKQGNKSAKLIQEGLKLANNAVFGKSNDKYSFLNYPVMTMQICLNGQLSLLLLVEMLHERLGSDNFQMIQANTDGITYKVAREYEDIENQVCDEWQEITKMMLETVEYQKMIIDNVNNYIAVKTDGSIKQKGDFEDKSKEEYRDSSWHKDHSMPIVAKALTDYFVHGISVEKTIKECDDIFMFYMMEQCKSGQQLCSQNLEGIENKEQKVTRYYICNTNPQAVSLYKKKDSKITKCNTGYMMQISNRHNSTLSIQDYNMDYNFYIRECNKKINNICNNQTHLFTNQQVSL